MHHRQSDQLGLIAVVYRPDGRTAGAGAQRSERLWLGQGGHHRARYLLSMRQGRCFAETWKQGRQIRVDEALHVARRAKPS